MSALSQADEYRDVRLKAGEKALYKLINQASGIKFPIKVDLALHAHKRSLLIQAELGGVEFPADEQYGKHKRQYIQDKTMVFSHLNRLIRCVVDCQLHIQDSVGARHALELARSFGARVWDNSPLQMKQIPQIGQVAIRKLAMGGINSIEALETTEAHRIETLLSKNPPFGQNLLGWLKDFPKLRVSLKLMGKNFRQKQSIQCNIRAECGFLNDRPPTIFHYRPIYVCLLVERSDGLLIDFRRISAKKLINGQDILMSASLTQHDQYLTSYVMCDEIAGTMRYAELKHGLPATAFPQPLLQHQDMETAPRSGTDDRGNMNAIQRIQGCRTIQKVSAALREDEFLDSDFDEQEFVALAAAKEVVDRKIGNTGYASTESQCKPVQSTKGATNAETWNPVQLENGKWACNHKCKDKSVCKHLCCREGVDRAPRAPKCSTAVAQSTGPQKTLSTRHGEKLNSNAAKKKLDTGPQSHDILKLESKRASLEFPNAGPRDFKKLNRLHEKINKDLPPRIMPPAKSLLPCSNGAWPQPSFLRQDNEYLETINNSSDYEDNWMDDLPSTADLLRKPDEAAGMLTEARLEPSDDEISDLETALIGLHDSIGMAKGIGDVQEASIPAADLVWEAYDVREEHEKGTLQHPLPADVARRPSTTRLFLSTESPEKVEHSEQKRKASAGSISFDEEPSPCRLTKKCRMTASLDHRTDISGGVGDHEASPSSSQTLDPSRCKKNECLRPLQENNALASLPRWTKDIDPDFLDYFVQEYGHLVEWWPEDPQVS